MSTSSVMLRDKAMAELDALLHEASRRSLPEATSASLATADAQGRPSVRIVYILGVEPEGLVFFVNTRSGKGLQMQENPNVALCFYWPGLQSQVTVEGEARMLSGTESDAYWRKRSRESQLAAWASEQSGKPAEPGALKQRLADVKQQYNFETAPCPSHWRAFRIEPRRLEFWNTGWRRLLARKKYQRAADGGWSEESENP